MSSRWVVEALADHHELEAFECGHPDLDSWLHDHARNATGQGTRTFVVVDEETTAVVGYFAVAPHLVERDELPRRVGRGAPRQVPAILLAKLALARQLQGEGLGAELLVRALRTVVEAARSAGGKLVVVEAIDANAAAFYQRHDFQAVPGNPRRLVMKLSSVAKVLGADWP